MPVWVSREPPPKVANDWDDVDAPPPNPRNVVAADIWEDVLSRTEVVSVADFGAAREEVEAGVQKAWDRDTGKRLRLSRSDLPSCPL